MSAPDAETIARGLRARLIGVGKWLACCPAHDDRKPSLSIRAGTKRPVLLKCFAGCSYDAITEALARDFGIDTRAKPRTRKPKATKGTTMKLPSGNGAGGAVYIDLNTADIYGDEGLCVEPARNEPPIDEKRVHDALSLWETTVPAAGTLIDAYRAARGLSLPAPSCVRFHPGLPHQETGSIWPAMVALIRRASDGAPLGIHRTFLASDGSGKAPVERAKKMLGHAKGGVVRLAEPRNATIMIGEGIETCLSVMQALRLPAWAALSAGNFAEIDLPGDVDEVLLLIDSDDGGASIDNGLKAAARWHAEGRRVGIAPAPAGLDFNDLLRKAGEEAIIRLCEKVGFWKPQACVLEDEAEGLIEFCDEALTLSFSDRYADELRYCERLGASWFQWDGCRWAPDEKRHVFTLARKISREHSRRALLIENKSAAARLAAKVASQRTVAAIVSLARCDERHATGQEDWDADPWALNTPGGTVDLRTGLLGPHDRDALFSKVTAATPEASNCPRWLSFLSQVTAGDRQLEGYLQRMVGYALTGSVREHALFFLYGVGANGKGTFLNTLTGILGDYSRIAGMETFTESHSDRHPTDLAMLRGARFVAAQETEAGRDWAEKRILALTGGDPITARFMRQDFFTYQPQFKLIIAGNHKPGLKNINEAIRRRFNMVPFTVTIPPEKRDKDLAEKLKAEWGAILAWAIEGCLAWQRDGLQPPAAVLDATTRYIDDQDAFGCWLDECCTVRAGLIEETSKLYAAWRARAASLNIEPGTEARFRENLQSRGFERDKDPQTRRSAFRGIQLNAQGYMDAWT